MGVAHCVHTQHIHLFTAAIVHYTQWEKQEIPTVFSIVGSYPTSPQ